MGSLTYPPQRPNLHLTRGLLLLSPPTCDGQISNFHLDQSVSASTDVVKLTNLSSSLDMMWLPPVSFFGSVEPNEFKFRLSSCDSGGSFFASGFQRLKVSRNLHSPGKNQIGMGVLHLVLSCAVETHDGECCTTSVCWSIPLYVSGEKPLERQGLAL
jgi:hypothetical protein